MSEIKVNLVTPRSGTTVTLGEAGDTIALGACASQTGFGASGAVTWVTTPKTATFTAVSTNGYFVNTTSGVVQQTYQQVLREISLPFQIMQILGIQML